MKGNSRTASAGNEGEVRRPVHWHMGFSLVDQPIATGKHKGSPTKDAADETLMYVI